MEKVCTGLSAAAFRNFKKLCRNSLKPVHISEKCSKLKILLLKLNQTHLIIISALSVYQILWWATSELCFSAWQLIPWSVAAEELRKRGSRTARCVWPNAKWPFSPPDQGWQLPIAFRAALLLARFICCQLWRRVCPGADEKFWRFPKKIIALFPE